MLHLPILAVMHNVEVDEEVFAYLQSNAKAWLESPNDVLRRLLITDNRGALYPLLGAGLLKAGDRLIWRRKRLGKEHHATVTAAGTLQLDNGEIHTMPSAACKAIAGIVENGWHVWRREHDGISLMELRDRIP